MSLDPELTAHAVAGRYPVGPGQDLIEVDSIELPRDATEGPAACRAPRDVGSPVMNLPQTAPPAPGWQRQPTLAATGTRI